MDASRSDVWPLPNVWLGVSVENQAMADERIPLLLDTPAAVRFLSVEPLLGPVYLVAVHERLGAAYDDRLIDWIIVGGESRTEGARRATSEHGSGPSFMGWRPVAGIPVFVKQLGERAIPR